MTELARLKVYMEAQTAKFQADLEKANKRIQRFEKSAKRSMRGVDAAMGKLRRSAAGFGAAFGAGFIANKFIQNTKAQQDAIAQLNASLKSTGGVAGRSAEQLIANAAALQKVSTFGDEAIISMQSVLLTFKQIRGVNFDRATQSILDMSTKLGKDLKASAQQVGKALEDPIKGVSALAEAGVQFTPAQKELIKALVETGQVAKAQEIILKELESQFGGSAKAARDTLGGALSALSNAFNDLFELSTEATGGVVTEVNKLTDTLSDPKIKEAADLLGAAIVRSLGFAVEKTALLVEKVQALGEVIAAVVSGASGDDVDKAALKLERLIALRDRVSGLTLPMGGGLGALLKPYQLKALDRMIEEARAEVEARKAFVKEYGTFSPFTAPASAAEPSAAASVMAVGPTSEQKNAVKKFLQEVEAATRAGTDALTLQRNELVANIGTLTTFLARYGDLTDAQLKAVGLTREGINAAITAAGNLGEELKNTFVPALEEIEVTARKVGEAMSPMAALYQEMLDEVRSTTETELEATERRIFAFSLKVKELIGAGLISAEEGQEFIQRFVDQQEKPFNQLEEFGKQAARNIQTSFADFLFDPFSDGLKGMLRGFLDMIRRMIAEAAAAQILKTMFGGLANSSNGFIRGIGETFGGGRAIGGQVLSNQAYLVGEKGPELLVGAAGKIIPGTDMGGGGSITIAPTYSIDARGATTDLIKQLPGILTEHARQTVQLARAAIQDDLSRGMLRG